MKKKLFIFSDLSKKQLEKLKEFYIFFRFYLLFLNNHRKIMIEFWRISCSNYSSRASRHVIKW